STSIDLCKDKNVNRNCPGWGGSVWVRRIDSIGGGDVAGAVKPWLRPWCLLSSCTRFARRSRAGCRGCGIGQCDIAGPERGAANPNRAVGGADRRTGTPVGPEQRQQRETAFQRWPEEEAGSRQ